MKTILEIQKKREQQLQQQIAEQKRLLDKLSNSSNMGTEEKAEILKQLKSIQSAIESNQNQAAAPFTTATTDAATTDATTAAETADSKEQASAELQKKLEHLEAEVRKKKGFFVDDIDFIKKKRLLCLE